MISCKKTQDLILTNYLDGEMDENGKNVIKEHLASCQKCEEFSITAKKVGNELFLDANRVNVPEYLWRRVRETILTEERERKAFPNTFFGKFKNILCIPKPALAILTIVVLLLAIGTVTKIKIDNQATINANISSQAEYFDYLTETVTDNSINNNGTFGTFIEKYFM